MQDKFVKFVDSGGLLALLAYVFVALIPFQSELKSQLFELALALVNAIFGAGFLIAGKDN